MDVNRLQGNRTQIETALTKARTYLDGINLLALQRLPHRLKAFSKIIRQEIRPLYLPEHRQLVLNTLIEPLMVQYNERLRVPPQQTNKYKLDLVTHKLKKELTALQFHVGHLTEKIEKYQSKDKQAELFRDEALMQYANKELAHSGMWAETIFQGEDATVYKERLDRLELPNKQHRPATIETCTLFTEAYQELKALKDGIELRIGTLRNELAEHQDSQRSEKQTLKQKKNYHNIKRLTPQKFRNTHVMRRTKNDARRHTFIDKLFGERPGRLTQQAAEFLRGITAFEEPIQARPVGRRLFNPLG